MCKYKSKLSPKTRRSVNVGRGSGIALCDMMDLLEWKPSTIIQVGIGCQFPEVPPMQKRWGKFILHGCEASKLNIGVIKDTYPGTIHSCAVGRENGTSIFYDKSRHSNGSTIFMHKDKTKQFCSTTVDVKTLDTIFPNPSQLVGPILLWLDCEGSELLALQGADSLLPHVDVINIEMTSAPLYNDWADVLETHQLLVKNGFLRQAIHTEEISVGQCDAIYVRHTLWKPEHCYCPCSFSEIKEMTNAT